MTREHTITRKIASPKLASLYAHVSFGNDLRVTEVRFSSPGKFADTTIEALLLNLGDAVTEVIGEITPGGRGR